MDLIDLGLGLAMVVLFLCCALLAWNDFRYKRKGLPPGTMGWPFFGETREFVSPLFLKERKASKYQKAGAGLLGSKKSQGPKKSDQGSLTPVVTLGPLGSMKSNKNHRTPIVVAVAKRMQNSSMQVVEYQLRRQLKGQTNRPRWQSYNTKQQQRRNSSRYGEMYKTHVLGWPTVISMNPDINRYILMNEKEGLVPGYPKAMRDILGTSNISAVYGDPHKTLRGALLHVINQTTIRERLMHKTDKFIKSYIREWGGKTLELQKMTKDMAILKALNHVADITSGRLSEEVKVHFYNIYYGTLSLPINLPGTSYRRGLKARKGFIDAMRKLIKERKASSETYNDMIVSLQNFTDFSGKYMSEDKVIDSIITVMYSGVESFSTTCMMASKYLMETPKALEEIRKEQMEITKNKSPEDPLDWNDYKSMVFTRKVVYETLRLATVINGVMRVTTRDVTLGGYVLPKGWKVYLFTGDINYDPTLYPEPRTFNPWRWNDKSLESHPHYMIFGGGSRFCPGKELAIADISIFLHNFVTRYSWEFVGGEELLAFPRVYAPKGLHVKVSKLEDGGNITEEEAF